MKKLIQGIVEFRNNLTDEKRALFAKLALGQKPDALFVACSDSRVVPNLFASTNPGDLFVLRNVGNFIPPLTSLQEDSVGAVLEFAIFSLNVADIVICGHSECGAMNAIANGVHFDCCSHLTSWLKYGQEAFNKVQDGHILNRSLSLSNQISQMNVLQQIEHIKTYPFINERFNNKTLRIHGWWFDIARAEVYCYEPEFNQYIQIDEDEGNLMIERMHS